MIEKIISGLQTGADQGGLHAAFQCRIATGGHAPLQWMTEDGPRPDLGKLFGVEEMQTSNYTARTGRNVFNSDGTMRFASDWNSPGEILTLSICRRLNKPCFDVPRYNAPSITEAAIWIIANKIKTLNVAGNRESVCLGIHLFTADYITALIKALREAQ